VPAPVTSAAAPISPPAGAALLASWHQLIDDGALQDGEPYLAGTARPARALLSAATAAEIGAADGGMVTVSTDRGAITLPLEVTEMPDRVVWVPTHSPGSHVRRSLAGSAGAVVRIARAEVGTPPAATVAADAARGSASIPVPAAGQVSAGGAA